MKLTLRVLPDTARTITAAIDKQSREKNTLGKVVDDLVPKQHPAR